MPICLFSVFILLHLWPSFCLQISLSLYEIRERSWGMWTIIFQDTLKWIGLYTSKKSGAIEACLNGGEYLIEWRVWNRRGWGQLIFLSPLFFFQCPLFIRLRTVSSPQKKGNKSRETLEGTKNSDIGFCKSNETLAALFHLTWRTGYKIGNSPPLAKKSMPWHENTLPNQFTSAPMQTHAMNS